MTAQPAETAADPAGAAIQRASMRPSRQPRTTKCPMRPLRFAIPLLLRRRPIQRDADPPGTAACWPRPALRAGMPRRQGERGRVRRRAAGGDVGEGSVREPVGFVEHVADAPGRVALLPILRPWVASSRPTAARQARKVVSCYRSRRAERNGPVVARGLPGRLHPHPLTHNFASFLRRPGCCPRGANRS